MTADSEQASVGARDSFAALLGGCRALFPPSLLAGDGWERVMRQAAQLPRCFMETFFGFEFHLGMAAPRADMGAVVRPGGELARYYVEQGERAASGSPAAALAAGLRAQSADPGSYLADSVAGVVLEYDLARLAPHEPAAPPGVFLAPRRGAPGTRPGVPEHGDPVRVLAELAAIVGWSGHQDVLRPFERILAALPRTGYVFQVGALPGRSPRAFRVLIKGVARSDVAAVLRRLCWPGSTTAVEEVLAAVDDLMAYVVLSLDVSARGPGPRLGLELYRPFKWFQVDRTGWHPFIARLVELGWCLPAKAEGLRAWPRRERLLTDGGGTGAAYVVRQGLNHVKAVVDGAASIVAKAYAGVEMRPVSATSRSASANA